MLLKDCTNINEWFDYLIEFSRVLEPFATEKEIDDHSLRTSYMLGFLRKALEMKMHPAEMEFYLVTLSKHYATQYKNLKKDIEKKEECGNPKGKKKATKKARKST